MTACELQPTPDGSLPQGQQENGDGWLLIRHASVVSNLKAAKNPDLASTLLARYCLADARSGAAVALVAAHWVPIAAAAAAATSPPTSHGTLTALQQAVSDALARQCWRQTHHKQLPSAQRLGHCVCADNTHTCFLCRRHLHLQHSMMRRQQHQRKHAGRVAVPLPSPRRVAQQGVRLAVRWASPAVTAISLRDSWTLLQESVGIRGRQDAEHSRIVPTRPCLPPALRLERLQQVSTTPSTWIVCVEAHSTAACTFSKTPQGA